MPSAQDYATIGHLYEAIRANQVSLDRKLGGEGLFLGNAASQVGQSVIDMAAAQRAIDTIVEQGEGASADSEVSHDRSFLTIEEELEAAVRDEPDFVPAWPVADSPVLRHPPEPDAKVFVNHPDTAPLLDFACAAYGLLLRCLVQCFGRHDDDGELAQTALMAAAIELMQVLGESSTALARLPASAEEGSCNAGMTFTMLRGVEPLPSQVERAVLRERVIALGSTRCDISDRARRALSQAVEYIEKLT